MKEFDLIVSGRDWGNFFKEAPLESIEVMQEKAKCTLQLSK